MKWLKIIMAALPIAKQIIEYWDDRQGRKKRQATIASMKAQTRSEWLQIRADEYDKARNDLTSKWHRGELADADYIKAMNQLARRMKSE